MSNYISDLDFVVPDDLEIVLPVNGVGQFFIRLEGGISTRLYLYMRKYSQNSNFANNTDATETLKDIALKIIREDKSHRGMTSADFDKTLNNFVVLKSLVSSVYRAMGDIANQPALSLPDYGLTNKSGAVDTAIQSDSHEIMNDIAFVAAHTAHTYQDIMDMPYVTFAALLRSLVLSEALRDPEYREAYEKHQAKEALKSGRIKRQQKMDYQGLKRFAMSL